MLFTVAKGNLHVSCALDFGQQPCGPRRFVAAGSQRISSREEPGGVLAADCTLGM